MRKLSLVLLAVLLVGFIGIGVHDLTKTKHDIQLKEVQLKDTEAQLIQLQQEHTSTKQEKEEQAKKIKRLQDEQKRLERDLQAKLHKEAQEKEKLAQAAEKALGTNVVHAEGSCNTGNKYKDFIYMHESSCNPGAVNSIGCRGIGQACPGSKLPCGNDFACQDKWFSNYAIKRYGSWEKAYQFWLANSWW
jgi:parvulin-like peptidyl-prolyl isomerase